MPGFTLSFMLDASASSSSATDPSLDLNLVSGSLDSRVTFTRASGASYFDATGTLQTAANNVPRFDYGPGTTNLLAWSNDLTHWNSLSNLTAAYDAVGLDGTISATTLTIGSINNNASMQGIPVSSSTSYVFSFYAKRGTATDAKFSVYDASHPQNIIAPTSYYSQINSSGFTRISVPFTTFSNTTSINVYVERDNSALGTLIVTGAQLEQTNAVVPSALVQTAGSVGTSTGVTNWVRNSTMQGAAVGAIGSGGLMPNNWSFNSAAGLSRQVVAVGTISGMNYIDLRVFGTCTTAGQLIFNVAFETSSAVAAAYQQTWTNSAYLQLLTDTSQTPIGGLEMQVTDIGGSITYQTGGALSTGALATLTRAVETVTTNNTNATSVQPSVWSTGSASILNNAYDVTIRIAAPQLEQGSVANTFVPTSGTIATVGASPLGLLIEEQRTNSIRNPRAEGAVVGTPGTLPTNWVIDATATQARTIVGTGTESGIPYIDIQINTGASNNDRAYFAIFSETTNGVAAAPSQAWAFAPYVRVVSGSLGAGNAQVMLRQQDAAHAVLGDVSFSFTPTTASLVSQRPIVTQTSTPANTAYVAPFIQFSSLSTTAPLNVTLRIGAPQLEQGAFATSLILPGVGSPAATTRAGDVATMPVGAWFNQNAGGLGIEWILEGRNGTFGAPVQFVGSNNGTDYISAEEMTVGTATAPLWAGDGYFVAGTSYSATGSQVAMNAGSILKGATSWAVGSKVTGAHNGTLATPGTTNAVPPAIVSLTIAGLMHYQNPPSIWARRIRYWPRALANSELQQVTT